MKKIALSVFVIVIIALLGVTLVACNNATTQGQLANLLTDHNSERFVYDVTDNSGEAEVKGVYTVDLLAKDAGSTVEFGNATLPNVAKGVLVTGQLEIGDTTVKTGCYYVLTSGSTFMTPSATYRVETKNGEEVFSLNGSYDAGKLNYTYKTASGNASGTVSAKAPFYDNNQFHQTVRCATTLSDSFSFGFTVPSVTASEQTAVTLTVTSTAKEKVKTTFSDNCKNGEEAVYPDGIDCYKMSLKRSAKVTNLSQTLWYAASDVSINGWKLKNVLVKFVEPINDAKSVVYTLTDATLA